MKISTAKPETGFCTPETELQDFTTGKDEYCCTKDRYLYNGNRKYEDKYCHTRDRFLYTGNRTLRHCFRQKYKDEYCQTRDRFLYTGNRTL
jgi:hypothetical protein